MRRFDKILEDWSNWAGLNDALYLPLGSVAHFLESTGRVLQDCCVIGCLPPRTQQLFLFQLSARFRQTIFVSITVLTLNVLFVLMSVCSAQKCMNNLKYIRIYLKSVV